MDSMRRAIFVVMALALPLAAQESAASQPAATATVSAAAPQADSPLVAAAKRMKRKGKKPTNVITNESLRQSGGSAHVTTTVNQGTLNMPKAVPPPRPTPEMEAAWAAEAQRKDLEKAAVAKKKAHEEAMLERARTAAAAEDGAEGRDDAEEIVGGTPPPPQF